MRSPIILKEKAEMPVRAYNPVNKYVDESKEPSPQSGILPHPVKIGVPFKNMQVGVHRLRVVLVLVGKTHILDRSPLTGAGLDVTSAARV